MIIWYNNSLLASIISVLGCAGIIAAVSELMKDEAIRELSVQEAACVIAAGVLMVILGKIISVNKAKKTQAKQAQAAPSGSNAGYGQSRQTAAYAQPAQAQPEPPRAVPVPPVQKEQPKQGNTAAGQAVNQDLEKKIQAYQDLLACGILSQEEYDQAIRELTRK